MKKLNLLQITPNLNVGGVQRLVCDLVQALDPEKFNISIICLYKTEQTFIADKLRASNVKVYYLNKKPGFDIKIFFKLQKHFRQLNPDIIHFQCTALPYLLPFIPAYRNKRIIHTIHNTGTVNLYPKTIYCNRLMYKWGVIPVGVSQKTAEVAREIYGKPDIAWVMNGINMSEFEERLISNDWRARHGIQEDEVLVASVARLAPVKNHRLLLRAFAQLSQNKNNFKLIIVGDGGERSKLETLTQQLGLNDRVLFLGNRADIPDILRVTDISVLASTVEGNPLAILESMAAGVPVIATRVGGVPEIVMHQQTGLLLENGDEKGLVNTLQTLIDDEILRKNLSRNAREYAKKHFDIKDTAAEYQRLYLQK